LLATERTRESFDRPGCLYLGAEEICSGPALKTIDSWSRNQPVNRLAITREQTGYYLCVRVPILDVRVPILDVRAPLLYLSQIC
jgi:hypothetical protein